MDVIVNGSPTVSGGIGVTFSGTGTVDVSRVGSGGVGEGVLVWTLSVTVISSVGEIGVSAGVVVSDAPQADVRSRNTSSGIKPWRDFIERSSLHFR
jgi:hypothetical protein